MRTNNIAYLASALVVIATTIQMPVFAANETGSESGKESGLTSQNESGPSTTMSQSEHSNQNNSNATTQANTEHSSAATSGSGLVPAGNSAPDPRDKHLWGAPKDGATTTPNKPAATPGHAKAIKSSHPETKTYRWNGSHKTAQ